MAKRNPYALSIIPFWKISPFVRIFVPLATGIFFGQYLKLPITIGAVLIGCLLLLLWFSKSISPKYDYRWVWGLLWQVTVALCGIGLLQLADNRQRADFLGNYITGHPQTIIATLDEPLVAKQKSFKANASISLVDSQKNVLHLSGKAILYLQPDDKAANLQYGSQILLVTQLKPIANSPNPGAFDYKEYCARQNIFYQAYIQDKNYKVLPAYSGHRLQRFLFDARHAVHMQLGRIFSNNPQALGLSEALLTGYRGDLDKEIVEYFANTGVVHVIAISGMHLALIFVLLQWLLKPIARFKQLRYVKPFLVLGGIWFFCLMTGAAPSAVRAAIMLTVLVIGQIGERKSPLVNSLAFAATLQLVIDPYSLWNVGFQLSYAAVLSIGIFYKPLAAWLWHPFAIINKVGQLAAVTVAAQVLTFPIALYHFHQMPLYFLISNLVVVPIITIVLYSLLCTLFLSLFIPVAWLSSSIAWLIGKTIAYVQWVNSLPANRLANILITPFHLVCLFAAIAFFSWWLFYRKSPALLWGMGVMLLLLLSSTFQKNLVLQQQQLIVYHVPGFHAIDVQEGSTAMFIGDSILNTEGFLKRFHLTPARIAMQSFPDTAFYLPDNTYTAISYNGEQIVFVDKAPDYSKMTPQKIDWMVPGSQLKGNLYRLLQQLAPRGVLIDGAMPEYAYSRWRKAADSLHLRLHIINQDGPFIIKETQKNLQ